MKMIYRILAYLIAALVAVQAAAVAYGFFSLGKFIEKGGAIDQAAMNNPNFHFPGDSGLMIHGTFGTMVIPIVALVFLLVSFVTHFVAGFPGAVKWGVIVFVTTIVQVALGLFAHSIPALGMLHGIVALGLFAVAFMAGYRVRRIGASASSAQAPARASEPVAG